MLLKQSWTLVYISQATEYVCLVLHLELGIKRSSILQSSIMSF